MHSPRRPPFFIQKSVPACGSRSYVWIWAHHSLLTNLAMGLSAEVGLIERDYYCQQCHFTWPKEGPGPRRVRQHLAPHYFIEGIDEAARAHPQPGKRGGG